MDNINDIKFKAKQGKCTNERQLSERIFLKTAIFRVISLFYIVIAILFMFMPVMEMKILEWLFYYGIIHLLCKNYFKKNFYLVMGNKTE